MLDFSAFIPANWDRDAVQRAIVAFFAIGPIASLLLLSVTWAWGPRIFRKLANLAKGDYALTNSQLEAKYSEEAWDQTPVSVQNGYKDYQERMGESALGFSSWLERRERALNQGNMAILESVDRVQYFKRKHNSKKYKPHAVSWGRAQRRAERRAKRSGRQFDKRKWEYQRYTGDEPGD